MVVNGMGGTPQIELHIAYRRAAEGVAEKSIAVTRRLVVTYTISLEMQGFLLSALKLDPAFCGLSDASMQMAALRRGC